MGAASSSQQAAASVAVLQAVPQSDDPGAVMVIATPVEVSPSGSLILILCNDPQHDIFMNAKQRIVHLPVVHETRTIPTLTDIMKQHGWRASPTMVYHEMDFAVIETGRDKGLCGVGLGTSKKAYERASSAALGISLLILEGVYNKHTAQLHKIVVRLKKRIANMTPFTAVPAPVEKEYDGTVPDWSA